MSAPRFETDQGITQLSSVPDTSVPSAEEQAGIQYVGTILRGLHPKYANLPDDKLFPAFEGAISISQVEDTAALIGELIPLGYPRKRIPALYRSVPASPLKEKLAYQLLERGQIPVQTIYKSLPSGDKKTSMGAKLLERGDVQVDSITGQNISESIAEEVTSDPALRDLVISGMSAEEVGMILMIKHFKGLTDPEKLEKLRSGVTKAMIRPYLGLLEGHSGPREMPVVDMMQRVPKEVFTNEYAVTYNLVQMFFEKRLMSLMTENITMTPEGPDYSKGLAAIADMIDGLDDPDKQVFLRSVHKQFETIAHFPISDKFNSKIDLKGTEYHFPSFEQRSFVYHVHEHGTRLLTADTGLGKTGAAYLAMESMDVDRVLVLAPASGRASWQREHDKLFKDKNEVFVVTSANDLDDPLLKERKYIVIGQEVLGQGKVGEEEVNQDFVRKLQTVMNDLPFDGLIMDEVDNFSNPQARRTQTALQLVHQVRENYLAKQQAKGITVTPSQAPIFGLTATPIRSSLADMNVLMGMLYPDDYVATDTEAIGEKKTFSMSCYNDPKLTYIKLIGERRMFRWESAKGVQSLEYNLEQITPSPFEQHLYNFIADTLGQDALNKIRMLESALLNPLLVKKELSVLAKRKPRAESGSLEEFDIEQTYATLIAIAQRFSGLRAQGLVTDDEYYLSADKLVEMGYGDMVLSTFLSDLCEEGIDSFVQQYVKGDSEDEQLIQSLWRKRPISAKYARLEELVRDSLTWKTRESDGVLTRSKVILVSPGLAIGRTRDVTQRQITYDDGHRADLYANYELHAVNQTTLPRLMARWTEGLVASGNIITIDAKQAPVGAKKDAQITRITNDPHAAAGILTLEANYQSRDYTLNVHEDEQKRQIDGVHLIYLGWPWDWQEFKQMTGRFIRQGHLDHVTVTILHAGEFVDGGKYTKVRFTDLLTRVALTGVTLSDEDREFFDEQKKYGRIAIFDPEKTFVRDHIREMRGKGEEALLDFVDAAVEEGETHEAQKFGEKYYDESADEQQISGYNAEFVAELIKGQKLEDAPILSIGAGTLLLQRQLKKGIDNVDINPYMMEAGWEKASQYGGKKIVARASSLDNELFPDGKYSVVDLSYVLHWSKLQANGQGNEHSERVRILSQINRVLQNDGLLIFTSPEGAFDDETFTAFAHALQTHFGFSIDPRYSGKAFGRNVTGAKKRLGWSMVARKTGETNLESLDLSQLEFVYELQKRAWVSSGAVKGNPDTIPPAAPAPSAQIEFESFFIENLQQELQTIHLARVSPSRNQEVTVFSARPIVLPRVEPVTPPIPLDEVLTWWEEPIFSEVIETISVARNQPSGRLVTQINAAVRRKYRDGVKITSKAQVYEMVLTALGTNARQLENLKSRRNRR